MARLAFGQQPRPAAIEVMQPHQARFPVPRDLVRLMRLTLRSILLGILGGLLGSLAVAQAETEGAASFADGQAQLDRRLEASLSELAKERDRIAKEKIPLSGRVARLERDVSDLRRERARIVKVQDASTIDLVSLRKQVESLREQRDFIKSRLGEFQRDFEGRLDIAEFTLYEELTTAASVADKDVSLDEEQKRDAQLAVVRAALDRLRLQLGGQVFDGAALSPEEQRLTQGKFISLGPTVFFVSADGAVKGLVENQLNAADPVVVALPAQFDETLLALAESNAGALPLDPTLGKALKVVKAQKTLGEYIADGGVVGYVIIALGAASLLLTFFKALEILRFPVAPAEAVDEILGELERGSQDAAAKRAAGIAGVSGEMLSVGVQHAAESRGVLEELLYEKILRVRPDTRAVPALPRDYGGGRATPRPSRNRDRYDQHVPVDHDLRNR